MCSKFARRPPMTSKQRAQALAVEHHASLVVSEAKPGHYRVNCFFLNVPKAKRKNPDTTLKGEDAAYACALEFMEGQLTPRKPGGTPWRHRRRDAARH